MLQATFENFGRGYDLAPQVTIEGESCSMVLADILSYP